MSIPMSEKEREQIPYIYGGVFALANRMQLLGDSFHEEITTKQWFLLAVVSKFKDEPKTIGQIASIIGTSRQNVKKMAVILEKQGYIVIQKDKMDARILRLNLTKECEELSQKEENREKEYLEELFSGINEEVLEAMYQGFQILESNIIKMEAKYGKKEE